MRGLWICALAVGVWAGAARADGPLPSIITPRDQQRLAAFDQTRQAALAAAREGGSRPDVAVLETVLGGQERPFGDGFDLSGDWRCRVLKLGREVPLVVYGWFRCRVTDDGSGWRLVKTSGSQRTSGRFYTLGDTRLVYLGAMHLGPETATPYGADRQRDQVAIAVRPDADRVRLEFPSPEYDSMFDILDMRR